MSILSSILFSLSSNTDNLTVGIAYGIKKVHINVLANLLIALVSCIGTYLSMSIGLIIANFLPVEIANLIGSVILIVIGMYFIIEFIKKHNNGEKSKIVEENKQKRIKLKESLTISFALTINNLGLGIGASITGLNIYLTSILTFIVSILAIIVGQAIGKTVLSKIFGKYATLCSGLLITILGVYEIFT